MVVHGGRGDKAAGPLDDLYLFRFGMCAVTQRLHVDQSEHNQLCLLARQTTRRGAKRNLELH
jgi:hypothetical protein